MSGQALAEDLASAALSLARRFAAGATLWCCAPEEPSHARHVAVEFVHPVIVGKRALPAVALTDRASMVEAARANVRSGDVLLAIAPASDPLVADLARRAPAWGADTVWIGAGARPTAGAADHVLWLDDADGPEATEGFVRIYHLLWELTHVCFEHPGLLEPTPATGEVCITCSDEGRLAEVMAVDGDEATVRTAEGRERVDTSLVEPPRRGDLVLVHAGSVIGAVGAA